MQGFLVSFETTEEYPHKSIKRRNDSGVWMFFQGNSRSRDRSKVSDASSHTEWKSEREEDAPETFVSVRCVIPLFVSLFRCPLRCQKLDRAFHGSLSCDFLSSSLGILQMHLSLTACLWIPLVVYSSLLSIPPLLLPECVSRAFAVFPRNVWFCRILLWRQTLDWESLPMFFLWPKSFWSFLCLSSVM